MSPELRQLAEESHDRRIRREQSLLAVCLLDQEAIEAMEEIARAADLVEVGGCRFAGMVPA